MLKMITKGNDTKVQNEVIAQTITDETAKRLKLARLFPKQEIKENSDYYTYFRQNINLDEAIKKGLLGEAKDIAPGASLQARWSSTKPTFFTYFKYFCC